MFFDKVEPEYRLQHLKLMFKLTSYHRFSHYLIIFDWEDEQARLLPSFRLKGSFEAKEDCFGSKGFCFLGNPLIIPIVQFDTAKENDEDM